MAHITVGTTSTRADYTASSSQTAFSVPFEFFDEDDLLVYKNNVLLTKTTNYTVTPVTTSDGGFDGGTVTLTSGAALNDKVAIVLSMPYERSSDFPTAGPFNVTTLNTTLDKNAVRFKQLDELSSRSIKGPTSEAALEELPKATDRASRIMSFDSSGNPTTVATDSLSLATLQAFTDYRVTTATGNGSTTAFTLSADPGQEGNTQVHIDGIYQSKSNYSVAGTTLTFSTAPPNGSAIEIVHGQAAGTYIPPDNSIAMEKILTSDIDTDLSSVSGSDDTLPSAKAVKTYVDAQVTAQDLDFQADSGGALNIDLDSESLTIAGGTGIDTVGSGNTVTTSIDSTVATLTGSQTLTNKTLTATGSITSNPGSGANILFQNGSAAALGRVTFDATGTGHLKLRADSGKGLKLGSNGADHITMDTSGKLGIASTVASNQIQIGNTGMIGQDSNTLYVGVNFSSTNTYVGGTNYVVRQYFDRSTGTYKLQRAAQGAAASNISYLDSLVVDNAGNATFSGKVLVGSGATGSIGGNLEVITGSTGALATFGGATGDELYVMNRAAGVVGFQTNSADLFEVKSENVRFVNQSNSTMFLATAGYTQLPGGLSFTNASAAITGSTADGSDNQQLHISPGGAAGSGRGATISMFGNENTSGLLEIKSGDAGGDIDFYRGSTKVFELTSGGAVFNSTIHIDAASTGDTLKLERALNSQNNMVKLNTGGTDDWILGERNDSTSDFHLYSYGNSKNVVTVQRAGGATTLAGDTVTIHPGAANRMLHMGTTGTAGGTAIQMLESARYNWQISSSFVVSNDFEITPSTASGNSTFSAPALKIAAATKDTTFAGNVSITSKTLDIVANSDSVPAIKIGANATHGWQIFELATGGHLRLNRLVSGTSTQVLDIARDTGHATFQGSIGLLGGSNSANVAVNVPHDKYVAWYDSGTSGGMSAYVVGQSGALHFGGNSFFFDHTNLTTFAGNIKMSGASGSINFTDSSKGIYYDGNELVMFTTGTDDFITLNAETYTKFAVNSLEKMRLTGDNLGINQSNPQNLLHITDTSSGALTKPIRLHNNATGASTKVGIEFTNSTDATSAANSAQIFCERTAGSANALVLAPSNGTAPEGTLRLETGGKATFAGSVVGNTFAAKTNPGVGNDEIYMGFSAPNGLIYSKNSSGAPASNISLGTTAADGTTSNVLTLSYDKSAQFASSIKLGGETAAANALDDYEEGTWTPALTGETTAGTGQGYTAQVGRYTKIGRIVHVQIHLDMSSIGTAAGVMNVSLPFTSANTGCGWSLPMAQKNEVDIPSNKSWLTGYVKENSTIMLLQSHGDAVGSSALNATDLADPFMMQFSGSYEAA